jgi:hypothetical protein
MVSTRHRQVLHAPAGPLTTTSQVQFTVPIAAEPGPDSLLAMAALLLVRFLFLAAVFHLSLRSENRGRGGRHAPAARPDRGHSSPALFG